MIDKRTAVFHKPLVYRFGIDGIGSVAAVYKQVLPLAKTDELLAKRFRMAQIAYADCLFHVFVAVYRADAATGGTELGIAETVFFKNVKLLVVGQTHSGAVADLQVFGSYRDARIAQTSDLAEEMLKVDDHAVAHDVYSSVTENAGGEQVEDELSLFVDYGVTRIVAALIADYNVIIGGKQIDHTALAFVAPVDTYDSC